MKATDEKLASEIGLPNDGKSWPMEYESQRYMKFCHDRKAQKLSKTGIFCPTDHNLSIQETT